MIDEYAGELFADRFVDQRGDDGGINAAGKAQHDFLISDLGADVGHRFIDKVFQFPEAVTAALFLAERDGFFSLNRQVVFGDGEFEQREPQRFEPVEIRLAGRYALICANDQSDRFFLHDPVRRSRVWHDHGIDPAVADQPCRLLNVFTDKIQQDDCFRCLFHLFLHCLPLAEQEKFLQNFTR